MSVGNDKAWQQKPVVGNDKEGRRGYVSRNIINGYVLRWRGGGRQETDSKRLGALMLCILPVLKAGTTIINALC